MPPLPRLRWYAVGFALLACGLRIAAPYSWGLLAEDAYPLPAFLVELLLPLGLAVLVPVGGYHLVIRRYAQPPATFTATPDGFVAPTAPQGGHRAILAGFVLGGIPVTEAGPGGRVPVTDPALLGMSAVLAAACLALAVWALRRGPRVRLTPAGVEVRLLRTRRYGWDTLAPGGPPTPAPKQRELALAVGRADGSYQMKIVSFREAYVDGAFLAAAIRHYVEDPTHRAAIGTEAELHRLREALGVGASPAETAPLP
ncbi:hypothetical protein [Catellatospora bangladeshensis]|uniref:Uncharacterized protein n=1 Tax=Catellatospora bangladeshensis TaxID=310355 RepID=A0A8J3JNA9_9ACTN|nr:hypothetical protein [Catellatospora bangladeshensis]GIF83836.1 hypothetical protein Cba03nite_51850 [Catellatospora bangladeshensis]